MKKKIILTLLIISVLLLSGLYITRELNDYKNAKNAAKEYLVRFFGTEVESTQTLGEYLKKVHNIGKIDFDFGEDVRRLFDEIDFVEENRSKILEILTVEPFWVNYYYSGSSDDLKTKWNAESPDEIKEINKNIKGKMFTLGNVFVREKMLLAKEGFGDFLSGYTRDEKITLYKNSHNKQLMLDTFFELLITKKESVENFVKNVDNEIFIGIIKENAYHDSTKNLCEELVKEKFKVEPKDSLVELIENSVRNFILAQECAQDFIRNLDDETFIQLLEYSNTVFGNFEDLMIIKLPVADGNLLVKMLKNRKFSNYLNSLTKKYFWDAPVLCIAIVRWVPNGNTVYYRWGNDEHAIYSPDIAISKILTKAELKEIKDVKVDSDTNRYFRDIQFWASIHYDAYGWDLSPPSVRLQSARLSRDSYYEKETKRVEEMFRKQR